MKKQVLDFDQFQEYIEKERHLYASDSKTGRKLFILMNGSFEVEKDGVVVKRTNQPYIALETYNDL